LIGGEGNDTISSGTGSDSISGGGGIDLIYTDSGNDTIDGGAGIDVLTLTAGFTNITGDTITLVETLDMSSLASTMTVAQFNAFTSGTTGTVGTITFADAGTISVSSVSNAAITYVLANGTNTFTGNETTARDYAITGSTGVDTFNLTNALLTSSDVIAGGTGMDTLNITGDTATPATTALNGMSEIETFIFANTTTAVSISPRDTVGASGGSTLFDISGTSGVVTFDGILEDDGALVVYTGSGNDIITLGTTNALGSIVDAGTGNDQITGTVGTVGDNLLGQAGNDTFVMSTNLLTNDTIVGGIGTDTLTFTDTTTTTNELTNVSGIETITLGAAVTVFSLVDGNVAAGATLTITGTGATSVAITGTAELDGNLIISGNATAANTIIGGSGNDSLTGSTAGDVLTGGSGNDTIIASAGVDTITGGAGDDTIDLLGAGADTSADIVIFAATAALNGVDTITSFVKASDILNWVQGDAETDAAATFTTSADDLYQLGGQAAGAADSKAGVAAAMNAAATITAAAATAWIAISDDNSTAIYAWVDVAGVADEVNVNELTLVATIGAIMTTAELATAFTIV